MQIVHWNIRSIIKNYNSLSMYPHRKTEYSMSKENILKTTSYNYHTTVRVLYYQRNRQDGYGYIAIIILTKIPFMKITFNNIPLYTIEIMGIKLQHFKLYIALPEWMGLLLSTAYFHRKKNRV